MENWEDRSKIVANLLNPAFCGEILRRAIVSYNENEENMLFPFSLLYLILPIILLKKQEIICHNVQAHIFTIG